MTFVSNVAVLQVSFTYCGYDSAGLNWATDHSLGDEAMVKRVGHVSLAQGHPFFMWTGMIANVKKVYMAHINFT